MLLKKEDIQKCELFIFSECFFLGFEKPQMSRQVANLGCKLISIVILTKITLKASSRMPLMLNQCDIESAQNFLLIFCKVTSSNTSRLEAHAGFTRLLMKGIFDPYVL